MNNLNGNLTVAAIVLGVMFLVVVVISPFAIDKIKYEVIEELRSPYTPGPYTPGFDPDRVDPNVFRNNEQPSQNQQPWMSSWEQQRINGT